MKKISIGIVILALTLAMLVMCIYLKYIDHKLNDILWMLRYSDYVLQDALEQDVVEVKYDNSNNY